jgi:hypothetical protein
VFCALTVASAKTLAMIKNMGAGKGKNKRAQALKAVAKSRPALEVFLRNSMQNEFMNHGNWDEFVNKTGRAPLQQYYLGGEKESLSDEDYEKILAELFSDAVTVGAIILPDRYEAEDLTIKVVEIDGRIGRAFIQLKENPDSKGIIIVRTEGIIGNVFLSSAATSDLITNIAHGVQKAFA